MSLLAIPAKSSNDSVRGQQRGGGMIASVIASAAKAKLASAIVSVAMQSNVWHLIGGSSNQVPCIGARHALTDNDSNPRQIAWPPAHSPHKINPHGHRDAKHELISHHTFMHARRRVPCSTSCRHRRHERSSRSHCIHAVIAHMCAHQPWMRCELRWLCCDAHR
jgi:hypothetical protein